MELKVGQIWKHYKGKHYKMLVFCKHSETGEDLVVYQRQEDGNIYARPVDLFFQDVEWEGKIVPRFVFVSDNESMSDSQLKSERRKSIKIGFITIGVIILLVLIYGLLVATHWSDM